MPSPHSFWPLLVILLGVGLVQCHTDPPANPYETVEEVVIDLDATAPIPEGSFAWLHDRIFQPTCANSGCHDGSFEPDYRTIGSAWNTLVWHPVISNDAAGSFSYRVVPGNSSESLLMKRLTDFIPNTSGTMPLVVDSDSDWNQYKTTYITALETWIEAGAADINGNLPETGDLAPQITGFGGFPAGDIENPYPRDPEANYHLVVDAAPIDLWFAVSDDSTPLPALLAALRTASTPDSLEFATPLAMEQPFTFVAPDFSGNTSTYGHRVSLDLSGTPSGSTLYVQATLDDGINSVTIPSAGSQPYLIPLYSLFIP
ncbi:MAG TPA: hypothetical protein DCX00_02990 [Flavobacteriales bacterium]|nr:hypothetical protein [Flavobacteriales bacterium]